MQAVAPISRLANELADLKRLVAHSPAFQARCGVAGNSELAAQRVIQGELAANAYDLDAIHAARPFALIMRPAGACWMQYAGGDQIYLRRRGNLWLYLCDNSRFTDAEDDFVDACNFFGSVEEDLADLAGRDTWLPIQSIEMSGAPQRPSLEKRAGDDGAYWQCWYSIEWGLT